MTESHSRVPDVATVFFVLPLARRALDVDRDPESRLRYEVAFKQITSEDVQTWRARRDRED